MSRALEPMSNAQVQQAIARLAELVGLERNRAEMNMLSDRLEAEYGRRNYWHVRRDGFRHWTDLEHLSSLKPDAFKRAMKSVGEHNIEAVLDHVTVYSWAWKPRSLAAIVSQPYDFEAPQRSEIRELAVRMFAQVGLKLTWPDDFPSWHFPGLTDIAMVIPLWPSSELYRTTAEQAA